MRYINGSKIFLKTEMNKNVIKSNEKLPKKWELSESKFEF